jgi:hypothetical protein
MGSKPDTAETAPTMRPSTTPPAMTELSRFFREGVTAAWREMVGWGGVVGMGRDGGGVREEGEG